MRANPWKIAVALLLLLPAAAAANVMDFDSLPLGTVYGAPAGDVPGSFVFAEDGIDAYIHEFFSSGTPYFHQAKVDPPFGPPIDFGTGNILAVNNVGMIFDFPGAGPVTFRYLNLGGNLNLRVNGFGPILEDYAMTGFAGVVAPGVTMTVTAMPAGGGVKGLVALSGPVTSLRVGGQELWLEAVQWTGEPGGDCDREVDHETLAVGDAWGAPYGDVPGDLMFVEDGIPVHIAEIDWGTGTGFNFCQVDVPGFPGFGFNRTMLVNNVTNVYDIASLGVPVERVTFEYADLGGLENLSVNGFPLQIGDLHTFGNPAPGVTLSVVTFAIPGGLRGEVTLTGDVQRLRVGGQEFWLDNICVVEAPEPTPCDHLANHESLPLGMAWGGPHGESPGDLIFNEDGIDVYVTEFDAAGVILFNEARVDLAFAPAGDGQVLLINNIGVVYDVGALGLPVHSASFEFFDGAGIENIGVNGDLYVGQIDALPAAYFPGVTATVTVFSGPGYQYGRVLLEGDVQKLLIGGQQFYADNICFDTGAPTDVGTMTPSVKLALEPNHPNPFNPSTTLSFRLGTASHVRLDVCDVAGRVVRTLVEGTRPAGHHEVVWNGRDDSDRPLATGVYLVRLQAGQEMQMRKIALVK